MIRWLLLSVLCRADPNITPVFGRKLLKNTHQTSFTEITYIQNTAQVFHKSHVTFLSVHTLSYLLLRSGRNYFLPQFFKLSFWGPVKVVVLGCMIWSTFCFWSKDVRTCFYTVRRKFISSVAAKCITRAHWKVCGLNRANQMHTTKQGWITLKYTEWQGRPEDTS